MKINFQSGDFKIAVNSRLFRKGKVQLGSVLLEGGEKGSLCCKIETRNINKWSLLNSMEICKSLEHRL